MEYFRVEQIQYEAVVSKMSNWQRKVFFLEKRILEVELSIEEVKSISLQWSEGEDATLLCSVQPYMQFAHY